MAYMGGAERNPDKAERNPDKAERNPDAGGTQPRCRRNATPMQAERNNAKKSPL